MFFVRDLPRVSVDIDLAYVGFEKREIAFKNIDDALLRISNKLNKISIKSTIITCYDGIKKILCSFGLAEIKIETNYNARGCIYEPVFMPINHKIVEGYGVFLDFRILSVAELYGGKIHAAINRQHPRDLFDIKILLQNEAITPEIKSAFIYTILIDSGAHYELLNPTVKNQQSAFEKYFNGMSELPFTHQDHEETLKKLIETIHHSLTEKDKAFILNFYSLNPNWELVNIPNLQKLPAVQWKILNLQNLQKMNKTKFNEQLFKIQQAFDIHASKG
ncbi:MAG: nucleotidyl transferase AbiEii/AbiGii toxin family protein [Endomicrobium sp.]|uniref:nucleotidyl transferase AbiEii/AbiGii toxin family protein n=1 Tax=Candidatus Endomicrobiellum pyrsonymphae TaxID=1408203 RepID=UPI00357F7DC4|nr:nucleotidyl transferase AbiEii/AbiGii toxin family protein [Endomicrobium sp.]